MKSLVSDIWQRQAERVWLVAAVLAMVLTLTGVPRAAAQNDNVISGQILGFDAKPAPDILIESKSDQGIKQQTKTDKNGNFTFRNLRAGNYTLTVHMPNNPPYPVDLVIGGGAEGKPVILNFKDIYAKLVAANAEAQKQQKEEQENQEKYQALKGHFDAGNNDLTQIAQLKAQMSKTPADQRAAIQQQITDLSGKAISELEEAKKAAGDKDSNSPLLWVRLGDAYDAAGRTDDAINAYQQSVALKPTFSGYNNLGGILGRTGKTDESLAAYQKAAEADPNNAALAWRNAGITLYKANNMKGASEALKKATELDPKNAQSWYLLGAALLAQLETKKVGAKDEVVLQPGTVEAYQKAVELDPNGTWGQQAKEGLEQLKAIAPGIDTRIKK